MLQFLGNQVGGLVGFALMLGLLGLRRLARDPVTRKELWGAALLFLGYVVCFSLAQALAQATLEELARYARVASYLLFSFGFLRTLTSLAAWVLRARRGVATPKILRDVVDAVLYILALAIVLRATLKVDLGGLLATSAILSVVIGLALQETLGNLFAGLALQLDPPFGVGDWVSVGSHLGRVHQIGWRQTRIVTQRAEHVTVPNAVIAKESVINYSRSADGVARDLYVELDYDSPPNAVKQACLEVLAAHPRVRKHPAPLFRTAKWEASGVQYQVRFFLDGIEHADEVGNELLSQLWYRVRREGFSIPYPTRTLYVQRPRGASEREAERRELVDLLATVPLFQPLGREAIARLVDHSEMELYGREERVIREGDPGETFYLIVSGEVAVRAEATGAELARLRRGDFFGEMSLLTGEPRAATVVACQDSSLLCVARKAFGDILQGHEELAQALSQALAERSANLRARAVGAAEGDPVTQETKRIFARLRDIFRLR